MQAYNAYHVACRFARQSRRRRGHKGKSSANTAAPQQESQSIWIAWSSYLPWGMHGPWLLRLSVRYRQYLEQNMTLICAGTYGADCSDTSAALHWLMLAAGCDTIMLILALPCHAD